jgi:hypothetical protein
MCPVNSNPPHRVAVLPWLRRPGQRLLVPNWLAITIGRWILAWRPLDDTELAHELEHVRQWQRYGLLFIPRYLRASWRAARAGGDRYRDNLFERAARAAARSAAARVRE